MVMQGKFGQKMRYGLRRARVAIAPEDGNTDSDHEDEEGEEGEEGVIMLPLRAAQTDWYTLAKL
eukprot:COSAG06_NODE_7749_length_2390_cov_47.239197_2_plen_64_part_00